MIAIKTTESKELGKKKYKNAVNQFISSSIEI